MNIKKILFILSSVGIMTLTSCGGSGLRHPTSDVLRHYKVDLNHNGKIDVGEEDNLTWVEAYDKLISDANSLSELNKTANELNIDNEEPKRTSLARYEILHEAEELVMSTGAILPIYNYGDPYLLKPNLVGVSTTNLGYKYFDQIHYSNGSTLNDLNVSVGTKAESFDPAYNSDVSTCLALNQIMIGAKRYVNKHPDDRMSEAVLEDGLCTVEKKLVTSDNVDPGDEEWINIDSCPDLKDAIDKELEDANDYEGAARYTFELKDSAKWSDGSRITADDFIYAWARASSGVYNGQAFGIWCNMFDMIRGYNAWTTVGQQPSLEAAKASEEWASLSEAEQAQYEYHWDETGCAGGMVGVMKDNDYQFTVQLVNDSDYFESLLAFTAFMPVPKKNIISNLDPTYQKEHICTESGDWWLNKNGEYLTSGAFKINGPIDNNDGGGINLIKSESTCRVNSLRFKFIDKDSTIYDSYKSGTLQLVNQFPSSIVGELEKKPDWCVAEQLGLFFYDFNVNDNTFDIRPNMSETDRENLRMAAVLLVNRDDIAYNVTKKGSTSANGFVSDGIIETCVPEMGPNGTYIAKKNSDGSYKTANWHERNTNAYPYLSSENYGYIDHIMDKRDDRSSEGDPLGFFKIAEDHNDPESVKQAMEENTNKAIELAEKAGVHYDRNSGKFTNFPRINISTNNGTGLEDIAERLQAYYGLWGIDVTINTMEWQSFTATRKNGDFACARQGWVADYNDPRTYLDLCVSSSGNNDTQLGKKSWHNSH